MPKIKSNYGSPLRLPTGLEIPAMGAVGVTDTAWSKIKLNKTVAAWLEREVLIVEGEKAEAKTPSKAGAEAGAGAKKPSKAEAKKNGGGEGETF